MARYGKGVADRWGIGDEAEIDCAVDISTVGIISGSRVDHLDGSRVDHHNQVKGKAVKRKRAFTQIENSVLRDGELSANAKVLYCLLQSYAWGQGWCYPGRDTLAKNMGCQLSTVKRAMAEILDRGLVTRKRQGKGKTNIYHFRQGANEELPF